MNLEVNDIAAKILPLVNKLKGYLGFICILLALAAYMFIVYRIQTIVNTQPSDEAVLEKLEGISQPSIDFEAIETIEQLESKNVEIQSIFQEARDNPFRE